MYYNQGRIQEFQNGEGEAVPARYLILRSKVCFDAPSHIPDVFVRRVVNNIHIVNTVYVDYNQSIYTMKINKNKSLLFSNGWACARRAGPGCAFVDMCSLVLLHQTIRLSQGVVQEPSTITTGK